MTQTLAQINDQLKQARERAASTGSREEFALDQGLRIRVYPSGNAAFAYRYRAPGTNSLKTVTLSNIGNKVTAEDLQAALRLHRENRSIRVAGTDPKVARDVDRRRAANDEKQRKAEKSRREFTVRRLTTDYVDEISERKRTWAEDQRIFNVYVLPVIGDLPVAEVDRKAVSKVLKYLNGKAAMKRNVIAACRACWKWGRAESNPWLGEVAPPPPPRERTLSTQELRLLLGHLRSGNGIGRDVIELILLTGVRREEASGARREEFVDAEWRLPPERTKNKRPHAVILSRQAKQLVQQLLASHSSEWLFPSPVHAKAISPEYGYKWLKRTGADYTVHDIRRTMSSHLGEQLVHDAVIDRVLAHKKQGVIKHYNHARLTEPARKAWQEWADYLDVLRKPDVVSLEQRPGKKKSVSHPEPERDLSHVIRLSKKRAIERGVVYSDEEYSWLVERATVQGATSASVANILDASSLAKLNTAQRTGPLNELLDDYLAQEKNGVTARKAWLWTKEHHRFKCSFDRSYVLYVYPYERDEEIPLEADTKEYKRSGFDSALSQRRKKFSD